MAEKSWQAERRTRGIPTGPGIALVVIALVAGIWLGGGPSALVGVLVRIGDAHLASHNALTGPPDGRSEYLVVLAGEDGMARARAFLVSRDEPRFERDTGFPSTMVVSVPAGNTVALDPLRDADFTRFVLSDRWLAFCH